MTLINNDDALKFIHLAIHKLTVNSFDLDGRDFIITISNNGCRMVTVEGHTIVEQNIHKTSSYAARARRGERITWVIPPDKNQRWIRVEGYRQIKVIRPK
jgi:hypothetical protein